MSLLYPTRLRSHLDKQISYVGSDKHSLTFELRIDFNTIYSDSLSLILSFFLSYVNIMHFEPNGPS